MKRKTFGKKLYSLFLLSMFIPVVAIIICFGIYSSHTMIQREEQNIQNTLNSVSQNLNLQFEKNSNVRDAFYINKKVFQEAEYLNNPKLYQYVDELTLIDMENMYSVTLTKLIHTSAPEVRAVVFYPASEGDRAYYLGKESSEVKEIEDPGYHDESWFQSIISEEEDILFFKGDIPEYIPNKNLGELYSCVSPLKNLDNHKVIGVIRMDIVTTALMETLDTPVDRRQTGLVLLQGGKVFESSSWTGNIQIIGSDEMVIDGVKYNTVSIKVEDTNLEARYYYSRNSIYLGLLYVLIISMVVVGISIGLAFAIYKHNARRMVTDVEKITDVLMDVEHGKLERHIVLDRGSEFAEIAGSVNQMIDELDAYIGKEYKLVIKQKEAEYRALQSQINPHFLYNTLNGFVGLNRMGEKEVLEESIIGLSALFRYACSKSDVSELKDEFTFIEEYLKLEKLKLEERLSYVLWCGDECRNYRIPKLLLQPLVENSIVHGMGDTDNGIFISVVAKEIAAFGRKYLVLMVKDNGIGFNPEEPEKESGGIGAGNVRSRAELFDINVVYTCVSKVGDGTATTLILGGDSDDNTYSR